MFTVVCTGSDDATASASATLNVTGSNEPPTPEPTVSASLSATVVKAHVTTVDLTWNSTGTDWCERDGAALSGTSGSETGFGPFYDGSYSFTVTCGRDADTQTASATVTVRAATAVACSAHPTAPFRALRIAVGEHTHSVTGASVGTVFGDNPYTSDSPISMAAVHAGIVAVGESAIIRLTQENGQFSFSGTTRNGVTSRSLDSWRSQYTLEKVSDCEATAPAIPEAPANLVSSGNPSPDGSFSLSWDAPLGTGATPAGYLVYRSGSKSGYLSKTFADRTLSISGLSDGSYAYKVFACTGTDGDPDCGPVASITVTVEIPDNDNDGIPDETDPDDDNDGMTDVWEMENQLDPKNAGDATQDADSDGHTNLAEFNAGSDPHWELSKPGSIPVIEPGFDSSYTVQKGLINNDPLQDLLIRNPTSGILPAIAEFVLIRQALGGFLLQSTTRHTIPADSDLTSINSAIRLHDLNGDGVTDMLLHELDEYIDSVGDQIIYGNYQEIDMYAIPRNHVGLSAQVKHFFSDLSAWIDDPDYLRNQARIDGTVPISTVITDLPALTGYVTYGQVNVTQAMLVSHLGKCIGMSPTLCFIIASNGLTGILHDSLFEDLLMIARTTRQIAIYKEPDFQDIPSSLNVYDISSLDTLALQLVSNYFLPIRDSGTMDRGSAAAFAISETLGGMLNSSIFAGGLETEDSGVFPEIGEYSSYVKIVRDILKVFEYVLGRITPPCNSDNPDSCDGTLPPVIQPPLQACTPTFELAEYQISTTPSMPTINLVISNLVAGATINWEAQVEYDPMLVGCSGGPRFDSSVVRGQGSSFSPSFGGFFGGNLKVTASCSAPNYQDGSTEKTSSISGINPSDAVLGSAIPSLSSPFDPADLRRIACKENNFAQFTSEGLPALGDSGDAGLMQICTARTTGDFWNYKTNISSGRRLLLDKRDSADTWLEIQRTARRCQRSYSSNYR